MKPIVKDFEQAREYLHQIGHQVTSEGTESPREHRLPHDVLSAFDQFTRLADSIDSQSKESFTPEEITDIADQGLQLLGQIYQWTNLKHYQNEVDVVQQTSLLIVKWLIDNKGQIKTLGLVVDTLAALANKLSSEEALEKLSHFMGQILFLCEDEIKQDFDTMNPHRPWRILNLNRSIVATRTHNPDVMRGVFDDLLTYLPQDATEFFLQGLGEMERLNYPDHVQKLVQEFYDKSQQPRIH